MGGKQALVVGVGPEWVVGEGGWGSGAMFKVAEMVLLSELEVVDGQGHQEGS